MDLFKLNKYLNRLTDGWEIKSTVSFIFVWLFGEYNAALGALCALVVLDWITKWVVISRQCGSFWTAWTSSAISSRGMRDGLRKIIWYIVLLIVAHQLEQFSILGYTIGKSATEIASAYLALIEAKSILENLRDMGWKETGPIISMLGKKQEQVTGKLPGNSEEG